MVVALLGLSTMGIPFVGALGIAAAIVVTLAVLVALSVLPAILAVVGRNVDRWSISALRSAPAGDHRGGFGTGWPTSRSGTLGR